MRKISKLLVVAALSLLVGGVANAQVSVGIAPGIQIPLGDFGDAVNLGFGGSVSGEYLVTENIGVGLGLGYYSFGSDMDGFSASIMPIALNGKYYFTTEGFKPYGGLDLGYYILGAKVEAFGMSVSTSEGYIGLAPVLGFQYGFSDALALDVNAKYNLIFSEGSSTSTLGLNVGIVYSFGK